MYVHICMYNIYILYTIMLCHVAAVGSADLTGGQVFILAATSRPDLIDSALLRPGRIARCVVCGI